jgi:hypothetical protein
MTVEGETQAGESRLQRLRSSITKVRAGRGFSIPMDKWLMIAGALLMAAGLPILIMGWYGAAHTPYTFEQIPYVISGGLLGLGLMLLGGLFYFAYWLTRQVHETRRQADRTEQVFLRFEEIVTNGSTNGRRPAEEQKKPGTRFVTTGKGSMFHRADCVVVKGKRGLKEVSGDEPGLKPCKICDPLGEMEPETARHG